MEAGESDEERQHGAHSGTLAFRSEAMSLQNHHVCNFNVHVRLAKGIEGLPDRAGPPTPQLFRYRIPSQKHTMPSVPCGRATPPHLPSLPLHLPVLVPPPPYCHRSVNKSLVVAAKTKNDTLALTTAHLAAGQSMKLLKLPYEDDYKAHLANANAEPEPEPNNDVDPLTQHLLSTCYTSCISKQQFITISLTLSVCAW